MKRALMLVALLVSSAANAAWITLEPDDVAVGTDVSNYWDGVSIQSAHYRGAGVYDFVSVTSEYGAGVRIPTGDQVFASVLGGAWGEVSNARCVLTQSLCGPAGWNAMLLTFDQGVSDVSVMTNFGSDGLSLWLYDTDYNLVGSCSSIWGYSSTACYQNMGATGGYGANWQLTASSALGDIRYAVIGGQSAGGVIDSITYSVPEPGTLALLGVGLLGLAVRRRRAQGPARPRGATCNFLALNLGDGTQR